MTARDKEDAVMVALVESVLKRGLAVDVFDGSDYVLEKSTNKAAILAAMRSTGEDTVILRNFPLGPPGEWIAELTLIYGNQGWDVIHEFSWHMDLAPMMDEIMAEVTVVSAGLQEE